MLNKLVFSQDRNQIQQDNTTRDGLYVNDNKISEEIINNTDNEAKIQLHEEQLDIAKKWIQTRDVNIHKEVFTEEKTITVPVTREELVIETKLLDEESTNKTDGNIEVIRIPISEERIEVTKHSVVLEDIQIYKHQFQENKCIEETLKKEKLHLEITGDPKVINEETGKHS
jgi:conserved domain